MVKADAPRLVVVLFAALLATLATAVTLPGANAQEAGCTGRVVLDAGHGGTDTGAANGRYGLLEKEQNLIVARRLESMLEAEGYPVCMTRTGDRTLSNNDRYTYANTTGAQVLVSVHMNGSPDRATNYTTSLYGKPRKDRELADTVLYSGLAPALGIPVRSPYQFASGVLIKSNMPATIAETVFITSDEEGLRLAEGQRLLANSTPDDDHLARQHRIAEALKTGIEGYLQSGGAPPATTPGKK